MTNKLCLRLFVLTCLLVSLYFAYTARPAAACSPSAWDYCISQCDRYYRNCQSDPLRVWDCESRRANCERDCGNMCFPKLEEGDY